MSEEFKSFFNNVADGNESRRCNYTTRLDTYGRGCKHLPIAAKKKLIARVTGFREMTVCEDVYGHWLYWRDLLNANPDDCCNLRVSKKPNISQKQ